MIPAISDHCKISGFGLAINPDTLKHLTLVKQTLRPKVVKSSYNNFRVRPTKE